MKSGRKKIAFFPAHPSQIWMLLPVAQQAVSFADVIWVLRDKDCMVSLARGLGLKYILLSTASSGVVGNAFEMAANFVRCLRLGHREKIDIWVSKYGSANIAAMIQGKSSISFNDDDADIVPLIAWSSYPFADLVLTPDVTRMGRFTRKNLRYRGCHELFYLHPNRFKPDPEISSELGLCEGEPFAIMRFSALKAHHDRGILGIEQSLAADIIRAASDLRMFISSERALDSELEVYRINLPAERMHHALAFAQFFVGDSQTMTAEAAVLGTPAFRISSFVGRLSYIDELEKYGLAFGYLPHQGEKLQHDLKQLLEVRDRETQFEQRRSKFFEDKIDPVPWFSQRLRWLAEGKHTDEIIALTDAEES